eukprot:scaffold2848_cov352-Pavlova_lutheri.AAC.14
MWDLPFPLASKLDGERAFCAWVLGSMATSMGAFLERRSTCTITFHGEAGAPSFLSSAVRPTCRTSRCHVASTRDPGPIGRCPPPRFGSRDPSFVVQIPFASLPPTPGLGSAPIHRLPPTPSFVPLLEPSLPGEREKGGRLALDRGKASGPPSHWGEETGVDRCTLEGQMHPLEGADARNRPWAEDGRREWKSVGTDGRRTVGGDEPMEERVGTIQNQRGRRRVGRSERGGAPGAPSHGLCHIGPTAPKDGTVHRMRATPGLCRTGNLQRRGGWTRGRDEPTHRPHNEEIRRPRAGRRKLPSICHQLGHGRRRPPNRYGMGANGNALRMGQTGFAFGIHHRCCHHRGRFAATKLAGIPRRKRGSRGGNDNVRLSRMEERAVVDCGSKRVLDDHAPRMQKPGHQMEESQKVALRRTPAPVHGGDPVDLGLGNPGKFTIDRGEDRRWDSRSHRRPNQPRKARKSGPSCLWDVLGRLPGVHGCGQNPGQGVGHPAR